ncbi:MAG: tyrosine-type recombinase/integrase [Sedimentisphaerales bacterium]|jgi:integrase
MVKTNPKSKARSNKFPLTLHPTGQYCKKIKGKLYYFGSNKQQALQRYLEQASFLHIGATSESSTIYDGLSLKALCNLYLEHQHSRAEAGEIGAAQISDQTGVLREFVRYIGANCSASDISTLDLQNYRSKLIKEGRSAARINNHISAFKAMFHWATDNEVISRIPNLKAVKKLPRPREIKATFTPKQISRLLACAAPNMKAMIWLGLNCGFGCTDCSELLWEHLDLKKGRVVFSRTKTHIPRNLPLWKETINAIRVLPRTNERVFNTKYGNKYVRFKKSVDKSGSIKLVKCDNVTCQFSRLIKKVGLKKRKGVGFYSLRRTAATLAAQSGDPFAVQKLLGHADLKMATTYVQDVSEQTDRAINNVRKLIVQDDS